MQAIQPTSGRRQLRVERSVARVVQVEDRMGFPFRNTGAEVEDIGIGGMGLKMCCTALVGDRVRVLLSDPASREPMRFHAVVRWRRGAQFGLQWVNLTAEQQGWLKSLLRFWAGERNIPSQTALPGVGANASPA